MTLAFSTRSLRPLHGDSWRSPRWAVALGGAYADLSQWHIRAQVRQNPLADQVMFEWEPGDPRVVLGSAEVKLSSGALVVLGTIQLRLRPADWVGKPRQWHGVLDVELSSDSSDDPDERITVVRSRKFEIVPDVTRE